MITSLIIFIWSNLFQNIKPGTEPFMAIQCFYFSVVTGPIMDVLLILILIKNLKG